MGEFHIELISWLNFSERCDWVETLILVAFNFVNRPFYPSELFDSCRSLDNIKFNPTHCSMLVNNYFAIYSHAGFCVYHSPTDGNTQKSRIIFKLNVHNSIGFFLENPRKLKKKISPFEIRAKEALGTLGQLCKMSPVQSDCK